MAIDREAKESSGKALPTEDVLIRVEGQVGRLTLCRPHALNALSHEMALQIEAALLDWQTNDAVSMVLIDAQGEKAFCAGGDVAVLYTQGVAGDIESGRQFWRDEYRLNAIIEHYPKPYVAVMDGITMGGGVGISAHGSHRIVTERSVLAMPECSIGLVPDVGGTHLLSQSPEHLGEYFALTGARMDASTALFAGFADYYVPVARLHDLKRALIESGDVRVIDDFNEVPPTNSTLAADAQAINAVFGADTLATVLSDLGQLEQDWALSAAKKISRSSPIALALTFDLVRAARAEPGIEKALIREYRFVSRAMESCDILEGIRAALIDKDRNPSWKHGSIAQVSHVLIDQLKDPAPDGDVQFTSTQEYERTK